ncbi:hypothetical protein SHJG_p268 (plasmid) [Streptomyces hygroscopicus subsp. jinggangensis 5008]|nr:hypothetical protein SHJG_p268 [Streptomyces hygroscopicus subsp. jinggangensis 5008]AGF68537.1 hypothetical protein SHJGH_p268 [Streptomyces hygroscopicus subsp. jinggangensis TL01]
MGLKGKMLVLLAVIVIGVMIGMANPQPGP